MANRVSRTLKLARVLVVDDDAAMREALSLGLEGQYEVVCLAAGGDVIRALEKYQPNLLVLDVNMPDEDGHAVCSKVRSEARFRRLPILFMSGDKDDATFLKSLQSGGDAMLFKPFGISTFSTKVAALLAAYPPD